MRIAFIRNSPQFFLLFVRTIDRAVNRQEASNRRLPGQAKYGRISLHFYFWSGSSVFPLHMKASGGRIKPRGRPCNILFLM